MTTLEEKRQIVQDALDLMCDRVEGDSELAEVVLNLFCFVMQDMNMSLHDTMTVVMDYYRANPPNADH